MSTTSAPPPSLIRFYDIGMKPPVEKNCCSPNPWKARMALNFKGLPYSTTWVALPDVEKVRTHLRVPPVRKFADGTDFYTLPIIEDPATDQMVGDSFDIAAYLQKTYPDSGLGPGGACNLFPPVTLHYEFVHPAIVVPLSDIRDNGFPEYARFNMNVDAAFSMNVALGVQTFPFDPATEEISKAEFARRAGVKSWDDFALVGEARVKKKEELRDMLGGLGKLFLRDTSGPFILGKKVCYADFIVGAWLRMLRATLPTGDWEDVLSWHDGLFGRLHEALEVYSEVK